MGIIDWSVPGYRKDCEKAAERRREFALCEAACLIEANKTPQQRANEDYQMRQDAAESERQAQKIARAKKAADDEAALTPEQRDLRNAKRQRITKRAGSTAPATRGCAVINNDDNDDDDDDDDEKRFTDDQYEDWYKENYP